MDMKLELSVNRFVALAACFSGCLFLAGCGQEQAAVDQPVVEAVTLLSSPVNEMESTTTDDYEFDREDPRYLFVVNSHTDEELYNLLSRANDILIDRPDSYEQLDIVVIIHGPDVDKFRKKNYSRYGKLVDLAAQLDAYRIIDMKICETAMDYFNVSPEEVPPFIEPVPYAPDEIARLTDEGYYNL